MSTNEAKAYENGHLDQILETDPNLLHVISSTIAFNILIVDFGI